MFVMSLDYGPPNNTAFLCVYLKHYGLLFVNFFYVDYTVKFLHLMQLVMNP